MNASEYSNLDRVERTHWYYAGKRVLVRAWIERVAGLGRDSLLLDCGAGTGIFAEGMKDHCGVRVLDDHAESLVILRKRFAATEIIEGTATKIPLPAAAVDCVTVLDVLEHIDDHQAAVREIHRVLRPGGCVVATVPALMTLWSEWDTALHHFRRYSAPELQAIFPAADWELVHLNYTNVAVFPAVWLVRRWQKWRGAAPDGRMEDKVPPAWLNGFLQWLFVRTGLVRGVRFPFGVSLLLVARKRVSP
jgi:ubiquinone/menaquinone biosynthesis C-methylase UbiE